MFCGRFMVFVCGLSGDNLWADLRLGCGPIVACFFSACVWNVYYADMLDCVLLYVDIRVFRYIDMNGCKLYAVDIIIHDTEYKIWYVNVSYNIHYACDMI